MSIVSNIVSIILAMCTLAVTFHVLLRFFQYKSFPNKESNQHYWFGHGVLTGFMATGLFSVFWLTVSSFRLFYPVETDVAVYAYGVVPGFTVSLLAIWAGLCHLYGTSRTFKGK